MKYFLPDQETLNDIFIAYIDRGLQFEVKLDPYFVGHVLRVLFGEGSNAVPVLPLPAEKMQTPEAAQQWLEHLRDTQLVRITRGGMR